MKRFLLIFFSLYIFFLNISTVAAETNLPGEPEIESSAAIVLDAETGFILYEKNIHEQHYPASITKIMTALLAIEQLQGQMGERIIFSHDAVFSIPRDSSHIAMDVGETLTVTDALYGMMLASANEVANALAEHITGSGDTFAELMNRRASALGAKNTNFTNPSGLHSPEHVTTAYDMAVMLREAIKQPLFLEIMSTLRYDIQPTERQPLVRELLNNHRLMQPGNASYHSAVVGGKTGFTNEARLTIATYAVKDGRKLIVVVMEGESSGLYSDVHKLINYGFAMPYTRHMVFDRTAYAASEQTLPVYEVKNGRRVLAGEVMLTALQDLFAEIPDIFSIDEIEYSLVSPPELTAPIRQGDSAARLLCSIRGVPLAEADLRAANSVLIGAAESGAGQELGETVSAAGGAEEEAVSLVTVDNEVMAESVLRYFPDHVGLTKWEEDFFYPLIAPFIIFSAFLILLSALMKLKRRKHTQKNRYAGSIGHMYRR